MLGRAVELKDRFAHIWRYPALRRLLGQLEAHLDAADGQRVLDLGCGRGERSVDLLRRGAVVDGIDISEVYTDQAEAAARAAGFDEGQYTFVAGDAHALPYDDATFDLVVGDGILHHLDLDVALGELHRVLKPGGRALFREPLLDNPLLKVFRLLTPKARTDDELPLSAGDLDRIAGSGRWTVESAYCGAAERAGGRRDVVRAPAVAQQRPAAAGRPSGARPRWPPCARPAPPVRAARPRPPIAGPQAWGRVARRTSRRPTACRSATARDRRALEAVARVLRTVSRWTGESVEWSPCDAALFARIA